MFVSLGRGARSGYRKAPGPPGYISVAPKVLYTILGPRIAGLRQTLFTTTLLKTVCDYICQADVLYVTLYGMMSISPERGASGCYLELPGPPGYISVALKVLYTILGRGAYKQDAT